MLVLFYIAFRDPEMCPDSIRFLQNKFPDLPSFWTGNFQFYNGRIFIRVSRVPFSFENSKSNLQNLATEKVLRYFAEAVVSQNSWIIAMHRVVLNFSKILPGSVDC